MRGGVYRYAEQASPQIDAAMAGKNRFGRKLSKREVLMVYLLIVSWILLLIVAWKGAEIALRRAGLL